jgi:hypothetical protein
LRRELARIFECKKILTTEEYRGAQKGFPCC